MIINATMGTGFRGTLLYVYKDGKDLPEKQKPVVIEKNNVVGSPEQMARQMHEHSQNSRRLQKPVLHLSVSFAPEDKLTQEKEIECIKASMQNLGISEEKNQYVIVKHNDSNNTHYHIVTNKLNSDNKSLNTDWYKNDCVVTADKIEQEYNLTRTQGRKIIYNAQTKSREYVSKEVRTKNIENKQTKKFKEKEPKLCEYKTKIQSGIREALADKSVKTKEDFQASLKSRNIQAKISEKNNEIKGSSFRYDNKLSVKGSDVGYRWADISQTLEQNKKLDQLKKVVPIQEQKAERSAETKQVAQEQNVAAASPIQKLKNTEPEAKSFLEKTNLTRTEIDQKVQQIQDNPKTKLTMEEERQIKHIKNYNNSISAVIDKHDEEFKRGNINPDTEKIFNENGFEKSGTNEYKFNDNGFVTTHKSEEFEKAKIIVGEQLVTHKTEIEKQKLEDLKTLEEKPKKSIFGLSENDKEFNKNLTIKQDNTRQRQKNNQYKTFKPHGYGLEKEKFTKQLTTEIKQKQAKIAQEKIKEKEEEKAINKEQNKNLNKGPKL
jgi:hypothetical protein